MYYDYFGLKQPPFRITPDTSLFFPGGDRGAILDALIYAIVSGEGIVKLVGEVGSGKTTLCRMLEKELPENVEIVYLANPSLSPDNILHAIAFELALKVEQGVSRLEVMNSLQNYLLEKHAQNKQVVVFVEEAQSMPIATLEEIRLLSNLETAQNKLLQIVIFGQPELDAMIARQEIRQLKERITYSFYLSPLKPEEIRDYINSRLRACGYRATELFNDKAIKAIARYSRGLLRRINILADKALLASYAANMNTVTAKHVELAAKETEFVRDQNKPDSFRWLWVFAVVLILVAAGFLLPGLQRLIPVDFSNQELATTTTISPVADAGIEVEQDMRDSTATTISEPALPVQKDVVGATKSTKQQTDIAVVQDFIEPAIQQETPQAVLPSAREQEEAAWQQLEQIVYAYPEQDEATNAEMPVHEQPADTVLLDIEKLPQSIIGRTREEVRLLEQLIDLPPEAVMNSNSVATDTTCKLCSTIIYRPLKDDGNL